MLRRVFCVILIGLVAGAPAFAQPPVTPLHQREIDLPDRQSGKTVSFAFQGDKARESIVSYIAKHKKQCEQIGLPNCRVVALSMNQYTRDSGSLNLVIAPERLDAFLQKLTDVTLDEGVSVDLNVQARQQRKSLEEQAIERRLLELQRDALLSILDGEGAAMRAAARRQLRSIDSQLERIDAEVANTLGAQNERTGGVGLHISYAAQDANQRGSWGEAWQEILQFFVYSLAAVFGVAILTAIYFGILGFAFVRFRQYFRKIVFERDREKKGERAKEDRA